MSALASRILNRSKDYLLFNPLLEPFWLNRMRGKVTSLLYHRVGDGNDPESAFLTGGGSPVIGEDALRDDLFFFKRQGARFFTFAQLAAGAYPEDDEVGVAICFDDCFLSNYTHGLAVLNALDVKATFFQATAMVDASSLLWEHQLYWHARQPRQLGEFRQLAMKIIKDSTALAALDDRRFIEHLRENVPFSECADLLRAAQHLSGGAEAMAQAARLIYPSSAHLRQAFSQGHDLACHGHRHLKRSTITATDFESELLQSRAVLQQVTGVPPVAFSYPFDSYYPDDDAITRRHFKIAATVAKRAILRNADPMWIPRFTWPGPPRNGLRLRRWLLTGTI
jgi:peptidoglycan/xylan/chitin deacetylase (PgdA/CDA1 family)